MSIAVQGLSQGVQNGGILHWEQTYTPTPNAYIGELVFAQYCSQCHGQGDKLKQGVNQRSMTSDYYIIVYGQKQFGSTMPGFRTRLTQFQIYDILTYLNYDVSSNLRDDFSGFKTESP